MYGLLLRCKDINGLYLFVSFYKEMCGFVLRKCMWLINGRFGGFGGWCG